MELLTENEKKLMEKVLTLRDSREYLWPPGLPFFRRILTPELKLVSNPNLNILFLKYVTPVTNIRLGNKASPQKKKLNNNKLCSISI